LVNGTALSTAYIAGSDIEEAELRNEEGGLLADLTEAKLQKANLEGADLRYANLFETKLRGADLTGANLKGAMTRDRGKIDRPSPVDPAAFLKQAAPPRGPLVSLDLLKQAASLKSATMPDGQKYEDFKDKEDGGEDAGSPRTPPEERRS
jgi:pentapeptide repeat protein